MLDLRQLDNKQKHLTNIKKGSLSVTVKQNKINTTKRKTMSEKIKTKIGEDTDVRNNIIDFSTLDTEDREDDEAWDSLKYLCKSDSEEANYESPRTISQEAERRISALRARILGGRAKDAYNMKAA